MVTGHAKEAIVLGAAAARPTKGEKEEEMGEEDPPTKTEEEKTWRGRGGYLSGGGGGGGEKMQQRLFVPEEGVETSGESQLPSFFGESTGLLLLCRILATKKKLYLFTTRSSSSSSSPAGFKLCTRKYKGGGGMEGGLCCLVVAPFVLPGYAREAKRRFPRFLFTALSGFFLESPLEKEGDAHLPSFQHSKARRASPPGHTTVGCPNKGQGVENMAGKASVLNIFLVSSGKPSLANLKRHS